MSSTTIDIIGAGISGLATAYYLNQLDHDLSIRVWEKNGEPGGLAGTFVTEDFSVEKFYHHIFTKDTDLQELIADFKLSDQLVWKPAMTGGYYNNKSFRLSSPADILTFSPLSFINRIRLGLLVLHARSVKDWRKLDDITVKEYILRYAGKQVYSVLWEPLLKGKFGKHADNISAAWLWCKLVDRGGTRDRKGREVLGYLKGGLGKLFNKIIKHLESRNVEFHFNALVEKMESDDGKVISSIKIDGENVKSDGVICCSQVPDIAKTLPPSLKKYQESLNSIEFLANVCLILILKRSLSEFYWTNVTDLEAPFVGIIEQTNWANIDEFNQKHVVYISAYVTSDDTRLTMDPEALLDIYFPHIKNHFPEFSRNDIIDSYLWKAPYTQPIVQTGYRHLIPDIRTPLDNMFICTMAQIYPQDRQVSNGIAMAKKTTQCVNDWLNRK